MEPEGEADRTGDWGGWRGYMDIKRKKLGEQFIENGVKQKSTIFEGVVICVNGYTEPDYLTLRDIMKEHGGVYLQYPTSELTHTIATNLAFSKGEKVRRTDKIVKPEWIVDSVKAGRLLPDADYLLFNKPADEMLQYFGSKRCSKPARCLFPGTLDSADRLDDDYCDMNGICSGDDNDDVATTSAAANQDSVRVHTNFGKPMKSIGGASTAAAGPSHRTIPKTSDPNFLSEFYSHSRLHFISTLAQDMKDYVRQLKMQHNGKFPGRDRLCQKSGEAKLSTVPLANARASQGESKGRVLMHIDMDCFFISVGLRSRPELRGKPVAVTHSHGKGPSASTAQGKEDFISRAEIASCSYEARAFGIKNGMFLGDALKLCPDLQTLPYNFEEYRTVSKELYDTVTEYTLNVEAVSCDELFVDLTDLSKEMPIPVASVVTQMREDIKRRTQCPASAGVGPNMLIARLATRKAKPDGQFFVNGVDVDTFIKHQRIQDLPGIGPATLDRLEPMGMETCEDLQAISLSVLQKEYGAKTGQLLYNGCRGKDSRKLKEESMRKSVSCDVNYGIRFQEVKEVNVFLDNLAGEIERRMLHYGVRGKFVGLKFLIRAKDAPIETRKFLGCGACDVVNRTSTLPTATNCGEVIARECKKLAKQIEPVVTDIRGVGISMHKLEPLLSHTNSRRQNTIKSMFLKSADAAPPVADANSGETDSLAKGADCITNEPLARKACVPKIAKPVAATCELSLPSEIDVEFLNELPADIRFELRSLMNQQKSHKETSKPGASSISTNTSSPVSSKSGLRPGRGGKRKGRAGATKKRIKAANFTHGKEISGKELPAFVTMDCFMIQPEVAPKESALEIVVDEPACHSSSAEDVEVDFDWSRPRLAGCLYSDLPMLETLLMQLVEINDPPAADVRILSVLLTDLIPALKMDILYKVLAIVKRLFSQKGGGWTKVYQRICETVQKRVAERYGRPMRLP